VLDYEFYGTLREHFLDCCSVSVGLEMRQKAEMLHWSTMLRTEPTALSAEASETGSFTVIDAGCQKASENFLEIATSRSG